MRYSCNTVYHLISVGSAAIIVVITQLNALQPLYLPGLIIITLTFPPQWPTKARRLLQVPVQAADLPFRGLALRILAPFARSIRPWVPQLIPLLVGLSVIPLSGFLSTGAGSYAWKNAAVSWETRCFCNTGELRR